MTGEYERMYPREWDRIFPVSLGNAYKCSVGGSPTFFRALQTHDTQAVEPPSGGVRLAVRFFSPKIEALFEGNRASV